MALHGLRHAPPEGGALSARAAAWSPASARRVEDPHVYPAGVWLGASLPQPELVPSPAATAAQMVAQAGQGDGVTVGVGATLRVSDAL